MVVCGCVVVCVGRGGKREVCGTFPSFRPSRETAEFRLNCIFDFLVLGFEFLVLGKTKN